MLGKVQPDTGLNVDDATQVYRLGWQLMKSLRVLPFLAAVIAGCSADRGAIAGPLNGRSASDGPALISCGTSVTQSASGIIGPLGGVLETGHTRVSFPLGALSSLQPVTLTVPASNYAEIDVTVNGLVHYVFSQPVSVTIDYSRCASPALDSVPLSVWYIDSQTKALLENMGGTDDKVAHTITFSTGHFSGYAVAD